MAISNKKLILLIAAILVICIAAAAVLMASGGKGSQVVVTVNGNVWETFDLKKDQTAVLGPADGSWHNTLQIQNGKAAIVESDCDNQICVHTPALQEDLVGIIVCLPHGLVVELKESQ